MYFYILRFSISLHLSLSFSLSPLSPRRSQHSSPEFPFGNHSSAASHRDHFELESPVFFPGSGKLVWSLTWNREWSFWDFGFCEEVRIQEGSRERITSGLCWFFLERERFCFDVRVNGCGEKKRLEFSMMTGAPVSDRRGWWRVVESLTWNGRSW